MLTPSFAFAVLCFVLLLLFFSGLPNLKTCDEKPHPGAAAREPPRDSPVMAEMRAFVSCMA